MHYKNILQIKLGPIPPLHHSPSPMFPPFLHISVGGLFSLFTSTNVKQDFTPNEGGGGTMCNDE